MMLSKTQTVLSDIDGTLLGEKNSFSPNLPFALKMTMRKGVLVGLSTNRSLAFSLDLHTKLNLNGPIIYEDGAGVYFPDTRMRIILAPNKKGIEDAYQIIGEGIKSGDIVRKMGIPDTAFKYKNDDKEFTMSVHVRKGSDERAPERVKVAVEVVGQMISTLNELTVYDTGLANFFVKYKACGKHKAVEYLIENGIIEPKNTIVIGDGTNDVNSFNTIRKNGGSGIAVNNAIDELKQSADFITKGSESEGVIEILRMIRGV